MTRFAPVALLFAFALPAAAQDDAAKALKALEGKYTLVSMTVAGKQMTKAEKDRESFVIRDGKLIAVSGDGGKEDPLVLKLAPPAVDFTEPGKEGGPHMVGVYKLDGKTLTFCLVESDKPADRPKDVTATGDRIITMVLEKAAEPKDKK
jgi:uncharacterized protein (TIGR03067 family)